MRDTLQVVQVSAGPGEETAEKRGAAPITVETLAVPNQGRELTASAPLITCEDIAYADDDDFGLFEGLLSVLMIYGYVFILAVIFWNAHPISHWLYNHAQQLMGVLR